MNQLGIDKYGFRFFVNRNEGDWKMPVEFHSEYELFYALTGRGFYFVANRYYSFEAGDLLFIRSDELHKCQSFNGEPFAAFVILFDEKILELMRPCENESLIPPALTVQSSGFCHHARTLPESRRRIVGYLERLRDEYSMEDSHSVEIVSCLMHALLIEVARLFAVQDSGASDVIELPRGAKFRRAVMSAMSYINANYTDALTLGGIAAQVFVNPSYLSREFKKETGYSVNRFIMMRRISAARSLLRDSDRPVTEIASLCGYNNVTNFHWAFKKLMDMSPNTYRRQFRHITYGTSLEGDLLGEARHYVLEPQAPVIK
ncbi:MULTISPECIES: AraC family transcriptional regulator [Oscillospiraceae]|uniref:AraC family transcriptional regulator n=1 Tax=Harryflintia acetispora TaxID=1849041 RepID=A0A9X8Y7K7_9FIRM|nr:MULTISPECIES: AraC family transcriptional regulator [Oscillospiraceae]RGB70050.1 AraC family transcriptional regulator [Harryflintia acetispora]TCL42330.1 AraC family transcriptional regulator [Harryflintia acetispora]